MSDAHANPADDFEAAKTVSEGLKKLPKERQERVLRWVAEVLGIPLAAHGSRTPPQRESTAEASTTDTQATLAGAAGMSGPTQVSAAGSSADIATFIREKKPESDIQFVTAVAYYYKFKASVGERRQTIDAALAQEATRLAGWDRLTKPHITLNNAKGTPVPWGDTTWDEPLPGARG